MSDELLLFGGTSNPELAQLVAVRLAVRMGKASVERFPDGEVSVQLREPVHGRHVVIVQPTSPHVDQNLVELLCWADACRRASAASVTAVVPYFGYARSDKRHARREAITASLVAQLMQTAGVTHLVTLDLHAAQIEGFFQIPVDSLTAVPTLCDGVRSELPRDCVVVSPDMGRFRAATDFGQRLGLPVAVAHKRRESGTQTAVTRLVGDVRDRACLIIDDMISTGGTIATCIDALPAAGARPELYIAATHGLFTEAAQQRLSHPAVRSVAVTDSVRQTRLQWPTLRVLSVSRLLADAISRIMTAGSMTDLF
jgi:ribose-phosphate pyrophosphokinase